MSKKLYTQQEVVVMQFLVEHIGGHMVNIVRGAGTPDAEDLLGLSIGRGKTVAIRDLLEAALSTDAEPVATSYVLTESLMKALHLAATSRPTTIDVLLNLHAELDKNKPLYAAPPAPSVAVKALEWVDDVAEEMGLRYILCDPSEDLEGNGWFVFEEATNTAIKADGSPEGAKAAAQADYEARICSALSAQVQDVGVDAADIGRCLLKLSTENPIKWAEAEKKPILRGWFVGQVMKHFDDKPDEQLVRELVDTVFAVYPAAPAAKLEEKP